MGPGPVGPGPLGPGPVDGSTGFGGRSSGTTKEQDQREQCSLNMSNTSSAP